MSASALRVRRHRAILDGCLILLFILFLITNEQPADATINEPPIARETHAVDLKPDQALLDNNTLAAMIAAENAALTQPQLLIDLPLIMR